MHKKLRYYYTHHPLGEPKPSGAREAGQILSRHFFNMALLTFAIEKKMKSDQCKHSFRNLYMSIMYKFSHVIQIWDT